MTKINVRDLKKHLKSRSQDELIDDIALLFTRFDDVKNHYQFLLSGEVDQKVVDKYKAAIKQEFATGHTPGEARLSIARKVVTDYKKAAPSSQSLIDLMLFYVESGVKYTNAFGDINESFYSSMESMYQNTLKLIVEHQLQAEFKDRCYKIVTDTRGIGWGFHDTLNELYESLLNRIWSRTVPSSATNRPGS